MCVEGGGGGGEVKWKWGDDKLEDDDRGERTHRRKPLATWRRHSSGKDHTATVMQKASFIIFKV